MAQKEPKDWITVNGKHVPIYEGESKQDAFNRAVAKDNENKKKSDIAKRQKEVDKLNNKKETKPTSSKSDEDALVKDLVSAATKEDKEWFKYPDRLISNSDIQAVVEAYALEHKGVDEDKLLKRIRSEISSQAQAKYNKFYDEEHAPTGKGKSELFTFDLKAMKGNETAGDKITKWFKANNIDWFHYYTDIYADVDRNGKYYKVNHAGNGKVIVNRNKKYKPD